ncbi:MAG: hypothetical protein JXA37_01045 [Chloroflexia bacterium]|nr:hypothetical protein [Chloroflexia bacterium]
MARLIRWQLLFATLGILVVAGLLAQFSQNRQTVTLPAHGGTYREGVLGSPQYLNPLLASSDAERAISSLLFDGLSTLQPDGSVLPALAEGWEVSDSGTVYTCTLRSNAQWHDGEAVTAADVLFTLNLIRSPEMPDPSGLASLWSQVQVEALDKRQLRFVLERPYAPFLSYTTLPILPAHHLQGITAEDLLLNPFNLAPVGSGPFRFQEILSQEDGTLVLILEANPLYYRRTPYLDKMEFHFYRDQQALQQALLQKDVDAAFGVPTNALEALNERPDLVVYRTYLQAYDILFINTQSPILSDERVRQALSLGLDIAALVAASSEEVFAANGPISPISWAHKPDLAPLEHNPDQSRALLEESGWTDMDGDGLRERDLRDLALTLLTRDLPEERLQLARRIKLQLAPLGMAVRVLVQSDPELFRERLVARDYDLLLYGWGQLGRDPDEFALWHSSQIGPEGLNLSSFEDELSDLLLEQGRQVLNQDERTQIYWQFQERFIQEIPAIPLYYPVYSYVASSRIRGIELQPLNDLGDRFQGVANWYLKTEQVILGRSRPAPRYEGGEQP